MAIALDLVLGHPVLSAHELLFRFHLRFATGPTRLIEFAPRALAELGALAIADRAWLQRRRS